MRRDRLRGRAVRRLAIVAGSACLASLPALGQVAPSYAGVGGPSLISDQVPLERTIPEKEVVDNDMGRARLRLGPVRILPSVSVYNAGYDSNVFGTAEDPVGDWTATVAAGASFLIPFGPKLVLRADAFPQYTWYNELHERDQFGGKYNGSLYGFFNRMTTELAGSYNQAYVRYSSEVDTLVFQTSTEANAKVELELSSRWSLFGLGAYQDVRYEQIQGPPGQDIGVRLNDRTSTGGRGGVRYHFSPEFSLGLAGEGTFADFRIDPRIRNNNSTAGLATVQFGRDKLFINLVGGYRQGRGVDSDFFPDYSTGVGSFFVSYFPISFLEVQTFGHRSVTYSITVLNPYYFENRLGAKLNVQVSSRILLTGFGQFGPNNYPRAQPVDGELVHRRDEADQYGGGFSIIMWRPLVLTGRVFRSEYDSNIPGNSRSYTRYSVMISFTGVFER